VNFLLLATVLSFPDFSNTTGLTLVGDAAQAGGRLRLTPAVENKAGAAWSSQPVDVAPGFTTSFQFQITERGGHTPDWTGIPGTTGADGFALVIQNSAPDALGIYASGVGYMNIPNSLAIEFDTWANWPEYCEPDNNHIAVQTLGSAPNRSAHCAGSDWIGSFPNPNLGIAPLPEDISDGAIYTVTAYYSPGSLKVYVGFAQVLDIPLDIAYGQAYVGFTSSTGGAYENHDLLSWNYTPVPEPATPLLILCSLLLLPLFRRPTT
jgi:hypothetical protein